MTLARLSLTTTPIESLLGRVGTLQGTRGRAPGLPQGTPPFTERVEDVERVVEVGQAGGAVGGHARASPLCPAPSRRRGPPPRAPGIGRIPRPMSPRRAPRPSDPSASRGSRARRPSGRACGQKNLVGGALLDLGPGRLVEHLEQRAGAACRPRGSPAPASPRPDCASAPS